MKQVNPIAARLRDILRNYSSAQTLNELLQNADDAGSTQFKVLVDSRSFGTRSLLSPKLAHTQGPALYQFDDSQFNPEDYESIQRVGDGAKMGDPTKTGQFGLGFNSVYHFTDTPMFVSGDDFVVFDPQETHLPEGFSSGLYESAASLAQSCPDQLAPFDGIFGCSPASGWKTHNKRGTLFRLPLRTVEAASRSKIKDGKGGAPSYQDVLKTCVEPFLYQIGAAATRESGAFTPASDAAPTQELILHRRLLFLRFVELIEIWVWPPGAKEMQLLASARLVSSDPAARERLQAGRTALMSFVKEAMQRAQPPSQDEYGGATGSRRYFATMAKLDVHSIPRPLIPLSLHVAQPAKGLDVQEEWLVSMAFGDEEDVAYGAAPRQRMEKLTLMPYAAVAALVARKARDDASWELAPEMTGRAYATLPLPITTGLRVHLNGRWEIASDRNSLAPDDAQPRHEWNRRLAGRVCAAAYARLLREIANGFRVCSVDLELTETQRGEVVHRLLPPCGLPGVFGGAATGTMELLLQAEHRVWKVFGKHGASYGSQNEVTVLRTSGGAWVPGHGALFLNHVSPQGSGQTAAGSSSASSVSATVAEADVAYLIGAMGCTVTHAPSSAYQGFVTAAAQLKRLGPKPLTPGTARDWMRSPEGREALEVGLVSMDAAERRNVCRRLLAFIASDVPRISGQVYNPPEEDRTYSTVWGNNAIGTGHARSCLDSEQAWSAAKSDAQQWIVLKAGDSEVCLAGIVLQGRNKRSGHGNQFVSSFNVQFSRDGGYTWTDGNLSAPGDGGYPTNCKENEDTHQRIEFPVSVFATHVKILPAAHHKHISLRCGLLLGTSGAALADIPLIALTDGSVAAVSRHSSPRGGPGYMGNSPDLLLDLETDPSGQLIASCGLELLLGAGVPTAHGQSMGGRFVEDVDHASSSCARLLWHVREGISLRPFSPADAIEVVLPLSWKGKSAVADWQAAAPLAWLQALWASIDRSCSFGGDAASNIRERLQEWPIIPCGEELVQMKRADGVLCDSSGRGGGGAATDDVAGVAAAFAAFASLRGLGISIADPAFELKSIWQRLQPLNGTGVIHALGERATESGGWNRMPWQSASSSNRAAILDLISRDVGSLATDHFAALADMPLFPYEDAVSTLGPTACGALGPQQRRWTKPEFKALASPADDACSVFYGDDGSELRFLSRIPSSAPRAVLYSALHIGPMNRADFYAHVCFHEAAWRSLDEVSQMAQLIELQGIMRP